MGLQQYQLSAKGLSVPSLPNAEKQMVLRYDLRAVWRQEVAKSGLCFWEGASG